MKGKVASTKSTTKAYVSFCFPFPLLFRRLSTVFFIDSETNETIPLHFQNVFHFFSEKNSLSKTILVECLRSGAVSCNKRWEFWRETHTVASDWTYHFSHTWKNIVRDSDWTYHFFFHSELDSSMAYTFYFKNQGSPKISQWLKVLLKLSWRAGHRKEATNHLDVHALL